MYFQLWNKDGKWRDVEDVLRSAAYDRDINNLIGECIPYIVARPAIVQAVKGVAMVGVTKTLKYSSKKISKMVKSIR